MNVKDFLEKLKQKEFFKEFFKENRDSYFCAGFFVFCENSNESDKIQFDFFIPKLNKIANFEWPFSEEKMKIHEDEIKEIKEMKIEKLKVDLENLKEKIEEIKKEKKSLQKTNKIIAILKGGLWNINCMDNMLGMIKIVIDAKSGEVKKFEKGGIAEMMKFKSK